MRHHLPIVTDIPGPSQRPIPDGFLDDIRIATPCDATWDGMREVGATGRVRHCGSCKLNVFDLSSMTRAEAAMLVTATEGRLCVRLFRRDDGTVLTQDCWARLRAARRRGLGAFVATLVLVGVAQLWLQVQGLRWLSSRLPSWRGERAMGGAVTGEMAVMGALPAPPPPIVPLPQAAPVPAPSGAELGGMVDRHELGEAPVRAGREPGNWASGRVQRAPRAPREVKGEVRGQLMMGDVASPREIMGKPSAPDITVKMGKVALPTER